MNQQTKNTLIFSGIFFTVAVAVLGAAVWQVTQVRAKLVEEAALVAQNDAREQAFLQLQRVLEVSADDRERINSLFLTEDRTIDFLAELESVAASFGIEMQTTGLDLKPAQNQELEMLNIRLSMSGSERRIMRFLELLEVLPYHSRINAVTIRRDDAADLWEGTVHIVITSLAHD